MTNTVRIWPPLRSVLQTEFSFNEIKDIVGLAGLDVIRLAGLVQRSGSSTSKGELMSGIDGLLRGLSDVDQLSFFGIAAEEALRRNPAARSRLEEYLERLGWTVVNDRIVPLELFDPTGLADLGQDAHHDLSKAAQRFRDGDLSGAISAACGAVDATTSAIYAKSGLGDPGSASFQERCKKVLAIRGVAPNLEQQLLDLGWKPEYVTPFRKNFEGALNQGAYVLQTLRSQMGDVHGTKPILKPLVFDALKWAELLLKAMY